MPIIDFPDKSASPWTDPYQQVWAWNKSGWVRYINRDDTVEEAPLDGAQYVRQDGAWVAAPISGKYLGAHSTHPTSRTTIDGLQAGDVYFNTRFLTQLVWNGMYWQPFNKLLQAHKLKSYTWDNHLEILEGGFISPTDSYGNDLGPSWVTTENVLLFYVNGELQNESVAQLPTLGSYKINYTNATLQAVNGDLPNGDMYLEVLGFKHIGSKLFPYVQSISGPITTPIANYNIDVLAQVFIQATPPTEITYWAVTGANFDKATRAYSTNPGHTVHSYQFISDTEFRCVISGGEAASISDMLIVYNGTNREAFGEPLFINPTARP